MRLDRNIDGNSGKGKYALLKLREIENFRSGVLFGTVAPRIARALEVLEQAGILDWGKRGSESEFFVIRLKDKYAANALEAYALAAKDDDPEWSAEVAELADRASHNNPHCKRPD